MSVRGGFNTQPPEGGWNPALAVWQGLGVSTHSRPKAAGTFIFESSTFIFVSTHSRPKAAGVIARLHRQPFAVSTPSRPKAAGCCTTPFLTARHGFQHTAARRRLGRVGKTVAHKIRFNTQPPEGGWASSAASAISTMCFNTQPPEGGWDPRLPAKLYIKVSTHSRPKAAGTKAYTAFTNQPKFQHTAARRRLVSTSYRKSTAALVSTHSRPKAAGFGRLPLAFRRFVFQHTAARRRLASANSSVAPLIYVSTHSRPKAAGRPSETAACVRFGFNTQPPEGGWSDKSAATFTSEVPVSTHSRPKAAGGVDVNVWM